VKRVQHATPRADRCHVTQISSDFSLWSARLSLPVNIQIMRAFVTKEVRHGADPVSRADLAGSKFWVHSRCHLNLRRQLINHRLRDEADSLVGAPKPFRVQARILADDEAFGNAHSAIDNDVG